MKELLERAAPLLRLPDAPDRPPEVVDAGLRCPTTGRVFPVRGGVLDLLDPEFSPTLAQRALDSRPMAWLYDRFRPQIAAGVGMPEFETEVRDVVERLELARGESVLDVACGHGNFTLALARHVGPAGLVIGLDIARAMLARAARHVREADAHNVLLVRGDALALPLADGVLSRVNCSGGLHQIPDLPRAVRELARVSEPDARLTASGFATAAGQHDTARRILRRSTEVHAVDLGWLAGELEAAGYVDVATEMRGAAVGYAWGRRSATRRATNHSR